MPDLPWTSRSHMEPSPEYLVMASHLPLRRLSSTVRFFRAVNAVRGQLAHTDGLIGYTLRAKPRLAVSSKAPTAVKASV